MIPKYRAWHKEEKRMYEVTTIYFETKTVMVKYGLTETFFDFKDITLIQSIGFKDKNGKEIFDGDIARLFNLNSNIYEVRWSKFHLGFRYFLEGKVLDNIHPSEEQIEVIGNIHKNPELLEGKK